MTSNNLVGLLIIMICDIIVDSVIVLAWLLISLNWVAFGFTFAVSK